MFFMFRQKLYSLLKNVIYFYERNKWLKYVFWLCVCIATFIIMYVIYN